MSRSVILWALAAVAGVVLVAGVTYAASGLSSQSIGLSSEPLGAGEERPGELRLRRTGVPLQKVDDVRVHDVHASKDARSLSYNQ